MTTRYERRRKRKRSEEIMSWVLLPLVLIVAYVVGVSMWSVVKDQVPSLNELRFSEMTAKQP